MVPLGADTLQYIAHELEHILERAEGVDLPRESERMGSGVWRALVGFETQRAIDAGHQVAREVRENLRKEAAIHQLTEMADPSTNVVRGFCTSQTPLQEIRSFLGFGKSSWSVDLLYLLCGR